MALLFYLLNNLFDQSAERRWLLPSWSVRGASTRFAGDLTDSGRSAGGRPLMECSMAD